MPRSKGLVFVLSAPAGTGKTTLIRMLQKELSNVSTSISCTTRPPRPQERDGVDYHFISKEEFQKKLRADDFLEHAVVFDYDYGTSKKMVEALQAEGKHVFLVIDTQGAMQIKKKISAIFIFLSPPSLRELRSRLEKRQTESQEVIEKRIAWAEHEMEMIPEYDYVITNEELHIAYDVLRSIVFAEEHRVRKGG